MTDVVYVCAVNVHRVRVSIVLAHNPSDIFLFVDSMHVHTIIKKN